MWDLFLRISLAGIMSGIIGFEREFRSKDAGLKTHFLVGVGSALMMVASKYGFYDVLGTNGIALDPSRIAAQVVSGIGFLGAGTIIFEKHYVKGLTTAAGIWATAGIGLALGSGMYGVGIFSTVLVLLGLEILNRVFKDHTHRYIDINIWTRLKGLDKVEIMLNNSEYSISKFKSKRTQYEEYNDVIKIKVELKVSAKDKTNQLINEFYEIEEILRIEIDAD